MYGDEWTPTNTERYTETFREYYRMFGLAIFESFEEYMEDNRQANELDEY